MTVETRELEGILGVCVAQRLFELFGGVCHALNIRRATAVGKCINFHTDATAKTLRVALDDESDCEGGQLVYATHCGFVQPARPAGCFTIHTCKVVHGVSGCVAPWRVIRVILLGTRRAVVCVFVCVCV
jgi:hypothetical protein